MQIAFNFIRILKSIEGIPGQLKDRKQYSQSSNLIVMESRSFRRKYFPGVQCSRLELELDQHLNRMVQFTTRYVFVCTQPVQNNSDLSYLNLVSFNVCCKEKLIDTNTTASILTLKAPITTKVVCFSRLLKCLNGLYGKQCGPRSDCSYRSSLFWVHAVCFCT